MDNFVVNIIEFDFNGIKYPVGHLFKVIGSSSRGLDIEDENGNHIYETLFINDHFISLSDYRDDRINNILNNECR